MTDLSLTHLIVDNRPCFFVKKGKPKWLRAQLPRGTVYRDVANLVNAQNLHTVCASAKCPNQGECWSCGVATLMILGDVCSRNCQFCNVSPGQPEPPDPDEPRRVAEAVKVMQLKYVVITSVTRDDLPDGGSVHWAMTIEQVRQVNPRTRIEVLIPDFQGKLSDQQRVFDAGPDVLNHNLETVARLYPYVRPQADYQQSIELLRRARWAGLMTKTGIMVGIGERDEEVARLMDDVLAGTRDDTGACEILTIGQYLQPSRYQLPVQRYVAPEQFDRFADIGLAKGFKHVQSAPMVRSSYMADQVATKAAD